MSFDFCLEKGGRYVIGHFGSDRERKNPLIRIGAPVPLLMETRKGRTFTRQEIRDRWIVSENITRYQNKLQSESNTDERKLLEELIAIEKAKLNEDHPD